MKDSFEVLAIRLFDNEHFAPQVNAFTRFKARQNIAVYFEGADWELENIVGLADFRRRDDGLFMVANLVLLATPKHGLVQSYWAAGRQLYLNVFMTSVDSRAIEKDVDIKAIELTSRPPYAGGGYMGALFDW